MAGAVTLAPVDVASAADSSPQTRTITGHFDVGVPDFVYLPVQVPSGVRQLDVSYGYDRPAVPPGVPGNALDIGIFDQRGHELGDHSGFRGWSGGFRDSFSISNSQATPGYLPAEVAAGARARKLDFIVSTDHNTSASHGAWGQLAGDDLLIVSGEEITSRNGHFVAAGLPPGTWIDWRYRAQDGELPRFLRDLHHGGAIAVAAHPFAPCLACAWKFGYAGMDAVEVWNGPWTLDDEVAVQLWNGMLVEAAHGGPWLPAMGNSDAHTQPQVIGLPHNVVLADDLTRDDVLDGLRAGRTWIAESADVDLTLSVSGGGRSAGIGERLPVASNVAATATLKVGGVPNGTVLFISDEGQTHAEALPAGGTGTVRWQTTPAVAAYVRAEVRYPSSDPSGVIPGPMAALTNPIFLGQR